jgi:hypothetical protein
MTDWIKFGAAALATWRVTHLLANEDGPADLIALVRDRLGNSEFGALGCWGRLRDSTSSRYRSRMFASNTK